MLKILQVRLQQYVNQELLDVQTGFRAWQSRFTQKAEEPEIKLPTSAGSSKSKRVPGKVSTSVYAKTFDCMDYNKLWKIVKEMGMPDHFICLLRNLYAGQEVTVKTRHRTMDRFQIGKGVSQGCILSPCLFNLEAEFSSVAQLCPTLCNPMNCSTPGLPVHHQLLESIESTDHGGPIPG